MGAIVKVSCEHCGKEWQCAVGSGMFLGGRDEIANAFLEKEQKKVGRLLDSCGPFSYNFYYRSGICNCCKNVVSLPVLVCSGKDGEETYVGLCPICGKHARVMMKACYEGKKAEEICPSCGSRGLFAKEVGMWD